MGALERIGDAVVECKCGAVFRVPAYSRKRYTVRDWLAVWRTPYCIELNEFPDEHGMHVMAKVILEKVRRW